MRLNSINLNINASNHKSLNTKEQAFRGLTTNFERKIYPEAASLKTVYLTSKKDIAGCPPSDIVKAIKNKSDSKEAAQENIKKFISSIQSSVSTLRELDSIKLECSKNLEIDKLFQNYFDALKSGNIKAAMKIVERISSVDNIPKHKLENIEKRAAKTLEDTLKEIHVLKKSDRVQIKYCAEGAYGYVFKISFKDKNNDDIFHSKAIKIYKTEENEEKQMKVVCEKMQNFYSSMTFDEYWQNSLDAFDAVFADANFSAEQKKSMLDEMKMLMRDNFESLRRSNIDDLSKQLNGYKIAQLNEHGCLPEANRSMYIKNQFGNLTPTNYIMPHYFDLKDEYALMEYSDDKLPPVKKELDLASLGLYHRDVQFNKDNVVCSRIIDYGGISQMNLEDDFLSVLFSSDDTE